LSIKILHAGSRLVSFFSRELAALPAYRSVKPNEHGRLTIEMLDGEAALLADWVRFWYKGELLPLPADLQRDLDETRRQLRRMTRRAEEEQRARMAAEEEVQRLRTELEQLRRGERGQS
jgi:hypothetical protein